MNNTTIPEAEVTAVKKVIEAVDEFVEIHKSLTPIIDNGETDLDRLHSIAYLHFVKDLIGNCGAVKKLLEISREDFERDATNNGERTVEDALVKAMMAELIGILD